MATKLKSKPKKPKPKEPLKSARFSIVGVVASAGGLDAFKELLTAVPVNCEMAFVLVPHLDPKHESQMVALLSKVSSLPVVEATQGMIAEANHVYVIPPRNFLTIDDGVLQLSEPPTPQGRETAIDFFLRSLAKDQGERSIGIVLSGTGSHGTLGIRDIKLAGGMAIAQQPTTAEFDAMPSSIIREGLADYVLAPAEMPATLMQYMRQPYVNLAQPVVPEAWAEDEQLGVILAQLRKHSRYDFSSYRKNMILRRIQRRMGLHHLVRLEQYVERLSEDAKEVTALYRDLLISVTAFFRDPEAYQALSNRLLPELASRDADRYPFRVWVPGCATGEEAYSLAMLLIEAGEGRDVAEVAKTFDPAEGPPKLLASSTTKPEPPKLLASSTTKPIQVFASDVDEAAIAVARAGIYPSSIASDVSPERLKRFFIKTDEAHYQIGKQLRESIVFSRQNVINDPPFSKLDLISCHNLLIYLEPEMQQKVIALFHFSLADQGVLMLGPSESIARADDLFEPIFKKWRIFQKVALSRRSRIPVRLSKARQDAETLLLISFSDKARGSAAVNQTASARSLDSKTSSNVEQLELELKSNSEELGSVIEELEGANEDLKTSNEEMMSMNEELQSANEELETSKEELQSLNEELSTVNLELLDKVTELDVANNEILNLIASTEIATLFLDKDLLIQRFTPPTVELLNLRSTDIGRPLSDITTGFIDNCLLSDCRKVIEESAPIQSEIEVENSRLYIRRILPYRSKGDLIEGVVITFVDLTDRLSLEKSLKESKEHLEAILDSAADSILTVDDQGIIASLNPVTEVLFGYPRKDLLGASVLPLLCGSRSRQTLDIPLLCGSRGRQTLDIPNAIQTLASSATTTAIRKDGTTFDAELVASRVDHLSLFTVVIRDVSQRKELQTKILEIASDEQRRIGQELHDGTQQELTGLSLIAGTVEDFYNQRVAAIDGDCQTLTLERAELSRLMLSASKLVQGLKVANQHVQSLSHGIMPVQIDAEGLQSALAELANATTVEDKVACHFVHSGALTIESNTVATHLYRIAQEAVNNAQRHGAARDIRVSLSADQHQIQLEVSDDGIGVGASSMNSNGKLNHGAGLQIMEYRASVIGGVLSILAGNNNGTTVRCTIPSKGNQHEQYKRKDTNGGR